MFEQNDQQPNGCWVVVFGMLITDVAWSFVGFIAGGEELVEGFKYIILSGEGEAVVADE